MMIKISQVELAKLFNKLDMAQARNKMFEKTVRETLKSSRLDTKTASILKQSLK